MLPRAGGSLLAIAQKVRAVREPPLQALFRRAWVVQAAGAGIMEMETNSGTDFVDLKGDVKWLRI